MPRIAAFLLGFLALRGRLGDWRLFCGTSVACEYCQLVCVHLGDRECPPGDASLGYYINSLVNVLLGRLFLRERLTGRAATACRAGVGGLADSEVFAKSFATALAALHAVAVGAAEAAGMLVRTPAEARQKVADDIDRVRRELEVNRETTRAVAALARRRLVVAGLLRTRAR